MHISFAVFADGANLSQEGKLNVLGVFDALQVGGFPAIHPRTHFVLRLKGSMEDIGHHTLTFKWLSPSDEELWSSDGELNVAPGPNPAFEMDLLGAGGRSRLAAQAGLERGFPGARRAENRDRLPLADREADLVQD